MTKAQILKKIAQLESLNDLLLTEVSYVDNLMRMIGFSEGIKTVKATAVEILKHNNQFEEDSEFHNQ